MQDNYVFLLRYFDFELVMLRFFWKTSTIQLFHSKVTFTSYTWFAELVDRVGSGHRSHEQFWSTQITSASKQHDS